MLYQPSDAEMSLSESHRINLSVLPLQQMGAFCQNVHILPNWEKPQNLCLLSVLGRKGGSSLVAAAKAKVLFIASADLLYGTLPLQENRVI